MKFNKKQFCKKLKESQDGLHLLDETLILIEQTMLSTRQNVCQAYPNTSIYWNLKNYPKLKDKLTELGFLIEDDIDEVVSRTKWVREKVGKFLFFNKYDYIERPVYKQEHIFKISICCGEEK